MNIQAKERGSGLRRLRAALPYIAIGIIVLVALAYRVYLTYHYMYLAEEYSPDATNYMNMAERLLNEGVYSFWGNGPDAYVSPGFPLFLAACMKIFGTGVYAEQKIKLLQAVLSALTVFLTWVLARQLTGRHLPSLIAAAVLSVLSSAAQYCCLFLTENLYFFTMLLFFVVFVHAVKREKYGWYALSGVLFCVTVMVRPLIFAVFPVLFLGVWFMKKPARRRFWLSFLCFVLGFVVLALPWWIRNVVVLGKFVLFATQSNPIYAGLAENYEALGGDPGFLGCIRLLFQEFFADPVTTVRWMLVKKFNIIFACEVQDGITLGTLNQILSSFLVMVGGLGTVAALFDRKMRWPALALLFYLALSFVFVPTSRYAVQYFFLLAIMAGYVICIACSAARKGGLNPPKEYTFHLL